MKYSKKLKNPNQRNFNKLYQFSKLHKFNIPKCSLNAISNSKYRNISFNNEYCYTYNNININKNNIDKYSNENLLKEISELKEKIKKYQNELSRAKREKKVQNIYISLLERKYISQLISKKENFNNKNIKNENNRNKTLFITNKEKFNENIEPNNLTKNEKNKYNKLNVNFNYKIFKKNYLKKRALYKNDQ